MDQDEFNEFVRRKPFRPYRIALSSGATFDIVHPDMAVVGFGSIIIGIAEDSLKPPKSIREVLISLMHVVRVDFTEDEESPKQADSNGQH